MRGEVRRVLGLVQVRLSHTSQTQCAVHVSCQGMWKGVVVVDDVLNTVGAEQDAHGME